MQSYFMTFEAEPLEEAGIRGCAWDKRRDQLPTLADVVNVGNACSFPLTVLADEPDEDFEVANAPVPLELMSLGHSDLRLCYF